MALITVRAARSDRRVLLWERDPRHPDGEAWISGDGGAQTHQVERTGAVAALLAAGLLVVVEPEPPAPAPHPAPVRDVELAPEPTPTPARKPAPRRKGR